MEARPRSGKKILVVDNSPDNRELLRAAFSASGHELLMARTVDDAIDLAIRECPDLIISDIHMPGQDGYEFLRGVKRDPRLRHIPFVFISASIWGTQEATRAMSAGADKFIPRSVEPEQLLKEIESLLGR